jgi:uncharacterized phage protein (TIGR01671 family)
LYRVYDKRKKRWRSNNIYIAPNENLYRVENSIFSKKDKLVLLDEDRFVVHRDTGLTDKSGILIYEGDIVKAEVEDNAFIIAEVIYLHERASYIIMSFKAETWYDLGTQVCDRIEVVGNVFDTPNLLEFKEEVVSEK